MLELIGLSNRIAIMRHGRVTAVVDAPPHDKPTEGALIALMLGDEAPEPGSRPSAPTPSAPMRAEAGGDARARH